MSTNCSCCNAEGASQQCPKCALYGVKPHRFCSQDCFKKHWAEHKKVHEAGPAAPGVAFLEAKAKEEGIMKRPSGLLFKVLEPGKRKKSPKPDDICVVHYAGTLIDGKQFDSSIDRNEPAQFAPYQVIGGWTEALSLMSEGEKWEVYIPFNLAYGAAGSPPEIPPYSALIFTIELIAIQGKGVQYKSL